MADVVLDHSEQAVMHHGPDGSAHRTDAPGQLTPRHELCTMGPRPDEQERVGRRERIRGWRSGYDVDSRH